MYSDFQQNKKHNFHHTYSASYLNKHLEYICMKVKFARVLQQGPEYKMLTANDSRQSRKSERGGQEDEKFESVID
jgi:hypothetical protein